MRRRVRPLHVLGVSAVAGIGFTVSVFMPIGLQVTQARAGLRW